MDEQNANDRLKDLPLQTENIAFKPEEMIECAKCRRSNPPNRLQCFYCAAELEITEAQSRFLKPNLRKLENWEKGVNVILLPPDKFSDEQDLIEMARLLKLEKDFARTLLDAGKSLPLARAASEKEAEIAQTRLREIGVETIILSDAALAAEKPPARLRGIEFFDDKLLLIFFNRDEVLEIAPEDVILIVSGAVFERKIAAIERTGKKGDGKILEATETASDETLIDIYTKQNAGGFRIFAKGFDFSTLAAEKEMLAKDNIKKLVAKLRQAAPNAKYAADYLSDRQFLAIVWEVDQKTDSQGVRREGLGKFNIGNLTTVNNLAQFTKYSRLQRHLL